MKSILGLIALFGIICECTCPPPGSSSSSSVSTSSSSSSVSSSSSSSVSSSSSSSSSSNPICGAVSPGKCYYISPTGSDTTGTGTAALPWRTHSKIVSRYGQANFLKTGDVVYFAPGTYSYTYQYNGYNKSLYLRGVSGVTLHGDPAGVTIDGSGCTSSAPCSAAEIESSSNVGINSMNFTGAYASEGGGIRCDGTTNLTLYGVSAIGNHGDESSNNSGLSAVECHNLSAYSSTFADNYETGPASGGDDQNDSNVVLFGGSNHLFSGCTFYNTAAPSDPNSRSGCLKLKHSCSDTTKPCLTVTGSTFRNCAHAAIAINGQDVSIRRNVIRDSQQPFYIMDWGGGAKKFKNILIEYNTITNSGSPSYDPSTGAGTTTLGSVLIQRNVFVDSATSYGNERALFVVDPYGSNSFYSALRAIPTRFQTDENCFYNTNGLTPMFSFYAAAGSYGSSGKVYSRAEWQALGYDVNSVFENPLVDAEGRATSAGCANRGRFGGL